MDERDLEVPFLITQTVFLIPILAWKLKTLRPQMNISIKNLTIICKSLYYKQNKHIK